MYDGFMAKKCRPKLQHYSYYGMRARTQLAILDHNHNVGRAQAQTEEGVAKNKFVCPKGSGHWVVKLRYEMKSYQFLSNLMDDLVAFKRGDNDEAPFRQNPQQETFRHQKGHLRKTCLTNIDLASTDQAKWNLFLLHYFVNPWHVNFWIALIRCARACVIAIFSWIRPSYCFHNTSRDDFPEIPTESVMHPPSKLAICCEKKITLKLYLRLEMKVVSVKE